MAVVRVSNIGDAVSATALINAIRANYPYCEITLFTNSVAARLLSDHPNIDRIVVFDRGPRSGDRSVAQKFFTFLFEGWRLRRQFTEPFDTAFMLEGPARALAAFFPARRVVGFAQPFRPNAFFLDQKIPNERAHPVKTFRFLHYQRLLSLIDATSWTEAWPSLRLSSDVRREAGQWIAAHLGSARYVVLAPGATERSRRWPAAAFARLAELVDRHTGVKTVVLGGRDELELAPAFAGSPSVLAIGEHSIELSAAIVERAAAVVSNDSSLMHVAVAMGTPAVTIFGSSDPEIAGYDSRKLIQVSAGLSCQPCLARTCQYASRPVCLEQVSASRVYGALAPSLEVRTDA